MIFCDPMVIQGLNRRFYPYVFALNIVFVAVFVKTIWLLSIPSKWTLMENDSVRYLRLSNDFWSAFFGDNTLVSTDSFYITPGYPFFLSLFNPQNYKLIIFFQFLFLAATQLLLYKLMLKYTSQKIANLGLLIYVVESSSNLESFNLLTETLFSFFFVLFLYLLCNANRTNHISLMAGIALGIAILIRPVGQVLLIPLILLLLLRNFRTKIMLLLVVTVAISSTWIVRNEIVYDVPQLSGIQSLNLLQYEGAGALAKENSQPLGEAQLAESKREISIVGLSATVNEIVSYRTTRGSKLIFENPKGFLLLHLEGAAKILFGPGAANLSKLTKHLGIGENLTQVLQVILVSIRILITSTVLIFIFLAIKRRPLVPVEIYAIAAWFLVIISSGGANAYSRFRVPLIPLEIIIVCLGLSFSKKEFPLSKSLVHRFRGRG